METAVKYMLRRLKQRMYWEGRPERHLFVDIICGKCGRGYFLGATCPCREFVQEVELRIELGCKMVSPQWISESMIDVARESLIWLPLAKLFGERGFNSIPKVEFRVNRERSKSGDEEDSDDEILDTELIEL